MKGIVKNILLIFIFVLQDKKFVLTVSEKYDFPNEIHRQHIECVF